MKFVWILSYQVYREFPLSLSGGLVFKKRREARAALLKSHAKIRISMSYLGWTKSSGVVARQYLVFDPSVSDRRYTAVAALIKLYPDRLNGDV